MILYYIKYFLKDIYSKITKDVYPIKNDIKLIAIQWHFIHFAMSYIPISLLLQLGFPHQLIFIPCLILTLVFAIIEIKQLKGYWNNPVEIKDSIADTILNQGCWVAGYSYLLIIVLILYIIMLKKNWLKP